MTDPHRHRIEEQVIGLCLLGRHMRPIDILTPRNFKNELHRRLFSLIVEMAPNEPVDIITVSRRYTLAYKELKAEEITQIAHVCLEHAENHYCLLLLEIDIREKFVKLLESYEKASVKATAFEDAAIWKQCRDHLASKDTDIFDGVSHIYQYLKAHRPDEVLEYEELMQAIPKLIDRIKSTTHTMTMLENLQRNAKMQGARQELFDIATNILTTLMVASELPKDLEAYLRHIQTEIL